MEKDYILKKIREVATALGGKSPSISDMEKNAGIKADKWKGKYWTKWAEALIEAGYKPNQFSIPAIGKEKCTVKILAFVRSINRIPQWLELKMHKQEDANFPSDSAIRRNFDGKSWNEVIDELKSYCTNNPAYVDILPLFKNNRKVNFSKSEDVAIGDSLVGYVYMIQHGDRKEYKIGKTNNSIRRLGEISIELPEQVNSIHNIKTDDPSVIEKYWHNRFKGKRKNGEWFELTPDDVKAFQRWKHIF